MLSLVVAFTRYSINLLSLTKALSSLIWETSFDQGLLRKRILMITEKGQLLSQIKNGFGHRHILLWQASSFDGWRINDLEVSFN